MFLETSAYPPILKRVFDLLEEEAARNGVCGTHFHFEAAIKGVICVSK